MYGPDFYQAERIDSMKGARRIMPIIIARYSPRSIIDVGCGVGSFLKVAEESGVGILLGIESPDFDRRLFIARATLLLKDVRFGLTLSLRSDLCISLEVGEHIEERYSQTYVKNLCDLSDRVVFSAAHPGQGGTNHVNEQPFDFWVGTFRENGYSCHLELRDAIKEFDEVPFWYRDNIAVFEAPT